MIYDVWMDGRSIYTDSSGNVNLASASLSIELGSAGSFEFSMGPSHPAYNTVTIMLSMVEIYEDNQAIWYGRVTKITRRLNGLKVVYCEGALAFLNDTIQEYKVYENETLGNIASDIIDNHNLQMTSVGQDDRLFTLVNVGARWVNKVVEKWEVNFETTMDALKKLVSTYGGAFQVYRWQRAPTATIISSEIEWVDKYGTWSNPQLATYGINIEEFNINYHVDNCWTVLYPVGKRIVDTNNNNAVYYTNISSVTGNRYIVTNTMNNYGWIVETKQWPSINDPSVLYNTAITYLNNEVLYNFDIELNMIDLLHLGLAETFIMVGQAIKCVITSMNLELTALAMSIEYSLTKASKKITLGYMKYPEASVEISENGSDSVTVEVVDNEETAIEKTTEVNNTMTNQTRSRSKHTSRKICIVPAKEVVQ